MIHYPQQKPRHGDWHVNYRLRLYSRVEGEAKQYTRGTGLGLAIVREIIRAHRGEVWATSTLGQDSSFHFTLPLKAQQG